MSLFKHQYQFSQTMQTHDITPVMKKDLELTSVNEGIMVVYLLHTTSAITIHDKHESLRESLNGIDKILSVRHFDKQSRACLKTMILGTSHTFIISHGQVILGENQSVYLCEFNGPQKRTYYIKIIEN